MRRGRAGVGGAGLAAIAVVVLLASGCGYGGVGHPGANHADVGKGQTLFAQRCGVCHSLQAAGTHGTAGPNLDNAFAGDVKQGYATSSIENVVLDQIRLGSITPTIVAYKSGKEFVGKKCLDPATKKFCYGTLMPANIVTGQDAIDVAEYVASVAGQSGYVTGNLGTDGATIFKGIGCAGCHALKAAGSTTTGPGPNLDSIASALTLPIVIHQVTVGGGVMPSFKGTLTPAQIQAVAQYVVSNAGK